MWAWAESLLSWELEEFLPANVSFPGIPEPDSAEAPIAVVITFLKNALMRFIIMLVSSSELQLLKLSFLLNDDLIPRSISFALCSAMEDLLLEQVDADDFLSDCWTKLSG